MDGLQTRGAWPGELEVRASGRRLFGRFPYSKGPGDRMATVSATGSRRKERIAPNAFGWQMARFASLQDELQQAIAAGVEAGKKAVAVEARAVPVRDEQAIRQELERRNVHILSGHDFDRPLGDMLRGGATVTSTAEAVEFEVDLPAVEDQPGYMRDTVNQIKAGLAGGISPGFQVPPREAVAQAERLEPEPGNPDVMVRVVENAVLYELSIVTRPAYSGTDLNVRSDFPRPAGQRRRVWQ